MWAVGLAGCSPSVWVSVVIGWGWVWSVGVDVGWSAGVGVGWSVGVMRVVEGLADGVPIEHAKTTQGNRIW